MVLTRTGRKQPDCSQLTEDDPDRIPVISTIRRIGSFTGSRSELHLRKPKDTEAILGAGKP